MTGEDEPHTGLDAIHLARWRGQALVQLAHPEALDAVTRALQVHDPAYQRAEAALRVDMARGLVAVDRDAAGAELARADGVISSVQSYRLRERASAVRAVLDGT